MTALEYLASATSRLTAAGISSTARLDVLVLLEDTLHKDRAHLLAHPEIELSVAQQDILDEQIRHRAKHIPLAYIRGKTEFYGRQFSINAHVLEPRPESEMMIDLLKFLPGSANLTIVDIGTGSGALAITAKLDLPDSEIVAVDIDPKCLDIARRNATKLKADVTFLQGNLLQPLHTAGIKPDALLCNLPYVPDNFQINTAATHEPKLAIFGGGDGLDVYRQLFEQITMLQKPPRYILTEALPPQHGQLAFIADQYNYQLQKSDDFIQVFRG